MKNRTMLRVRTVAGLAVVALAGSLTLAACSGGADGSSPTSTSTGTATAEATASPEDVAALAKVTVKGDPGKKPTITLPSKPFTVSAAVARVVSAGTGDVVKEGQQLSIHESLVQGSDGSALGDTYSDSPETMVFTPSDLPDTLAKAFDGAKVGTRILFANPTTDSSGKAVTYVYAIEIVGAKTIPSRASGTAVTPKAGLPTVTLADNGAPKITIPDGYKDPKSLVTQTLIKGSGAKVKSTDSVTVQYTGWLTDGTAFDSSWTNGSPVSLSLDGGVIEGFTKGLAGQTVGSQVLLVIPSSLGYGSTAQGSIPANSTLIFVVDILAVG